MYIYITLWYTGSSWKCMYVILPVQPLRVAFM